MIHLNQILSKIMFQAVFHPKTFLGVFHSRVNFWEVMNKSERLWVNQDNILTTNKKLVDVACVDFPVLLGFPLRMHVRVLRLQWDLEFTLFAFNSFWQVGLGCRAVTLHLSKAAFRGSSGICRWMLVGFFLDVSPTWAFLKIQLLKELDKTQAAIFLLMLSKQEWMSVANVVIKPTTVTDKTRSIQTQI